MTLVAFPVMFRADVLCADLTFFWQETDDYCRREHNRCGAVRAYSSTSNDLNALSEKHVFYAEVDYVEEVQKEVVMVMCSLVSAVGYDVPIAKKGYVELLQFIACEVQLKSCERKDMKRLLDDMTVEVEQFEAKVRFMMDESTYVSALQRQLDTQAAELA